ncbi:MAG: hypothetical protein IT424_10370 [Pirellulales bacterium]|nr:hypothetical protein [Pirellulales bacterium]
MDAPASEAAAAFGFITVLKSADHGLFGGYLAVSSRGRPLEFRCTTPVQATRAQEILYGPTLRPYLLAEVIGPALLNGAELPVAMLLTDERDMHSLALVRREEVLLVESLSESQARGAAEPSAHDSEKAGPLSLELGGCRIAAAATSMRTVAELQALLAPLVPHVCLMEPFERIRAALYEAQQTAPAAAEPSDDRAAAA